MQPVLGVGESLMVEQTESREGHDHAILVGSLDDFGIANAATWLDDVLHASLGRLVKAVAERKEGIGRQGDPLEGGEPFLLLDLRQWFGNHFKLLLPLASLNRGEIAFNEANAGVHFVLALRAGLELQALHLRVLPQKPGVGLTACEFDAVDPALLPSADTNNLPVLCIRNTVRLGVLDSHRGHDQVGDSRGGDVLDLRGDGFQVLLWCELHLVPPLAKPGTHDLAVLHARQCSALDGLEENELAPLLCPQDFERLGSVARCNDAIRDFCLENHGRGLVHHVTQGRKITETAHRVSVPSTEVGKGRRC
mmetsp:Transcript_22634/g.52742  ORF Transcript_22634/g.52742 Transcript_22634/m.52742 type:complete len:308 (+) Transcript_22634:86-1009(+)